MSSGKLLLGVVVGAVAGAIVGMVMAPVKGSPARKRLARTVPEYAEDVKEMVLDALTEEYDILKEGAMDWIDEGNVKDASVTGVTYTGRAPGRKHG